MFEYNMELMLRVCVFPIASMEFYQKDYLEELSQCNGYAEYEKRKSQGETCFDLSLYRYLNQRCRVHSLDQINLLVEEYYGYAKIQNKNSNKIYLDLLSKLAKSFVCHRNGRLALKYWESSGEEDFLGPYKGINKVVLWNSFHRLISTDLIVVQYLLDNKMQSIDYLDGYYSAISLEDLQLEQILQKGVAETHLHMSAGIHFLLSWTNLMNHVESPYDNIENPRISFTVETQMVSVIGLVRLLLVAYLSEHEKWDGLKQFQKEKLTIVNGDSSEKKLLSQDDKENLMLCQSLLHAIYEGEMIETIDVSKMKKVWELFNEVLGHKLKSKTELESLGTVYNQDYVFDFINRRGIHTSGENVFLFKALLYMRDAGKEDIVFQQFFWQYIRVKNQVFEAKVQYRSIRGLDYFQPFFRRSTDFKKHGMYNKWKVIMQTQLENPHLKKLELRCMYIKPKKSSIEDGIKLTLREFLTAYKEILDDMEASDQPPLIGLIFSFAKRKDEQWIDKCWQNAKEMTSQSEKANELWYRKQQDQYCEQVKALNRVRESIPNLDRYIVGIDSASIENHTEPWVFAHAYQEARDSKNNPMLLGRKKLQTLGFTYHVGEEFRHVLTGLRHIDEVITHFGYHSGDRLGHGIALGVNLKYWIDNNPVVIIPRQEYLEDLLWVWGVCKDRGNQYQIDIAYLEQKIMKLAESIYGIIDGITVYLLWKAYQSKFKVFEPDERYVWNPNDSSEYGHELLCKYSKRKRYNEGIHWTYEQILYLNHCRCYLSALQEPIQVEVTKENLSMYQMLQDMMIDKISNQGIVVETNPTSNLVIGEIKDMYQHYIFHLNEVEKGSSGHNVMVTINSDDPSVFNTNVSNEIAYMFYALQKVGYSRESALQWIAKIREYGMNSSFIRDRNLTAKQLAKEIEDILNNENMR